MSDDNDDTDDADTNDADDTDDAAGNDDNDVDDVDLAVYRHYEHDFSGQTVGQRYVLEKRLAVGSVSTFYRAKDRRLGTAVALKVLHPEHDGDADLARRFSREARIAAQVRHPNLVPALDYGWLGGKRYIAFELVEGRTVQDLLAEEPLPWRRATALICDLLAGLAALHEAGVAGGSSMSAMHACSTTRPRYRDAAQDRVQNDLWHGGLHRT